MSAVNPLSVSFRQLLADSSERPALAGALLHLWLLAANAKDASLGQQAVASVLSSSSAVAPHATILWQLAISGDAESLTLACQCIQKAPLAVQNQLLDRAIASLKQSQQVTAAANHILRLLADVCGVGEAEIQARYFKQLGASLADPGDLSSPQWWREAERQEQGAEQWQHYSLQTLSPRQARDVLGVSDSATEADVKQAYRRLIHNYHPDRHTALDAEKAEKLFQLVRRAYEVLKA